MSSTSDPIPAKYRRGSPAYRRFSAAMPLAGLATFILRVMLLLFLAGIGFTMARPLAFIILGLAIVTIGFFGAHSVLSAWTARRAGADRAQSASLYLLFYYMGGSVLGSACGTAWTHEGWTGVAACAGLLLTLGAGISAAPDLGRGKSYARRAHGLLTLLQTRRVLASIQRA